MLWKSVKNFILKYFSLKARLTLFFTLLIFILVTAVALGSYAIIVHLLNQAQYEFISSEIDTLKYYITHHNTSAVLQEINDVPGAKASPFNYYVRVYDTNTGNILQTKNMDKLFHLPTINPITTWPSKRSKIFLQHGRNYLLLESYIKEQKTWLVQVILDVSYQDELEQAYKKYISFILLLAALFSSILGYIIMQRGMRSLYDLTKAAHNITSHSLHQRIDPHLWPKELNALGCEFNQMLDRIEAAFLRLQQFSEDLAHEVRTPINSLLGATEVALLDHSLQDDYREALTSNLEDLKSIAKIIENLLFLANTEHPKKTIPKTVTEVATIAQKIIDYYQTLFDEKNLSISLNGRALIVVNPEMLGRMLSNVIMNAIKYTAPNGAISVAISDDAHAVNIKISDNGIGIPLKHLHRVFDRFYRVDKARSKESGGSGLGLSIVQSIVELHQGTIRIQSQENIGTCVAISLPKLSVTAL